MQPESDACLSAASNGLVHSLVHGLVLAHNHDHASAWSMHNHAIAVAGHLVMLVRELKPQGRAGHKTQRPYNINVLAVKI